jgi:CBS domain-containing protein
MKFPQLTSLFKKKEKPSEIEKNKPLVSKLMTKKVICIPSSFDLEKTANIFLKNKISGAPVVEKGFFIGVVSRADILGLLKKERLEGLTEEDKLILRKSKVTSIMKKPICIYDDESLGNAKEKMDKYNIKRLFVINRKNRLVGVISREDLVKGASKEKIKKDVSTKIDEMLRILEKGPTDFSKLSKSLKVPESLIEEWAKLLEEHDLVEISYPAMGSPMLKLKKEKATS